MSDLHRLLRYESAATTWNEALPLGNGRTGVMAFGGAFAEHLQINDGTAWSGSPLSERLPARIGAEAAAEAVASARAAVLEGRYPDAVEPLQRLQHRHSQAYVPFADLGVSLDFGSGTATAYSRVLDLGTARHTVAYQVAGARVRRELFVSRPDGVAVLTIESERPFALRLAPSTPHRHLGGADGEVGSILLFRLPAAVAPPVDGFEHPVEYDDDPDRSMVGAFGLGWRHDGTDDGPLAATGVRSATVVFATETSFTCIGSSPSGSAEVVGGRAAARVEAALATDPGDLRERQAADHRALFERASLTTGPPPADTVDRRLHAPADGSLLAADPALIGLLYDYGRYLLICSSRPGGVPANLQGIWNDRLQPMWSSNYTTNINLQMNYWQAEVAALPECAEPLFDLVEALADRGRETAARLYGAPGWVAHHNTDVWAYTQPVGWGRHDPRWAFWPMGGPWLCQHLLEHVRFGAGEAFVRERAWPIVREAARFVLHWLVELPDGSVGTVPSTSPENEFVAPDGRRAPAAVSSAMDLSLVTALLEGVLELAERIGELDDEVAARARAALTRIPPVTIARDGRVAEWPIDLGEVEPDHRHVSHLWSAYPGGADLGEALAAAVTASLDARGDASTGWSLVWKIALRARLGQAPKVSDLLHLFFAEAREERGAFGGGMYPNLFSAHPPFQIDGNLGFVAAITEALVQSHRGRIDLLPAVPAELREGELRGAVARPGIRVDLRWATDPASGAYPASISLTATHAGACGAHRLAWRGRERTVQVGMEALTIEDPVGYLGA